MPRPELDLDIPPLVTASKLLAARQFALASGISWPGIEDIAAVTGASPEKANEIEDALLDPPAASTVMENMQTPPLDLAGLDHGADLLGLAVEMVRFIKRNPGCAQNGTRERYAASFRRFVLELRWRHAGVTTAEFAATVDVPLATVEDWLRGGCRGVDANIYTPCPPRGARARKA